MKLTRWDYSKQYSNYHFDPTVDEDAEPHFKIVGNVGSVIQEVYAEHVARVQPELHIWLNRMRGNKTGNLQSFTYEYDENELEHLNMPKDQAFFYRSRANNNPFSLKMAELLGLEQAKSCFHIQKPGQVFPFHIDEIPIVRENTQNDMDPKTAARFEIQVFDWQPGHVWAVGNTYWKQWKSGDILWHDWRNTPHGTGNIGRTDRVTLQLTGLCTAKTLEIIYGDVA